jgi:signal transduction histidine kinase/CheY-like chemotaxis protein
MSEPLSYNELEKQNAELKDINKKLEGSLFKAETLYTQIINSFSDAVIVIQGDFIRFVNRAASDIIKVENRTIEQIRFSEIIHPDYRAEIIKNISQIVSNEKDIIKTNCKVVSLSGKEKPVSMILKKLLLIENQVSVLVKLFEKEQGVISDRSNVVSREFVDILCKYTDEGYVFLKNETHDNDKHINKWIVKEVNEKGTVLLQEIKNNIIDKTFDDIFKINQTINIPDDSFVDFDSDYEIFITSLQKYFKFNIYQESENTVVCKFSDISDIVESREQLNRNMQRYELFTEILNIFNSDKDYNEKYVSVLDSVAYHFNTKRIVIFNNNDSNTKSKLIFQHSEKGVSLLPDDFFMSLKNIPSWNKLLQERKMILGFSLKFLPEDIQIFFRKLNIQKAYVFPVFIEEGLYGSVLFESKEQNLWDNTEINYLKMVAGLISSLTSRKIYEEKLLKAKEKAEESDRLKSSFLANMSHDIRIPMTSILGFSDLLADPDLTIGEREEFIELISNSGQDLLTLVDNIVDIAKIETHQLKIQKDKVSLRQLFKDIYLKHKNNIKLINQDDLELILDMPEKYYDIPFETDAFRFKQIMNNLIDNAIKFTIKGTIHFGINNISGKEIEFYIQDTGIGIAEETQHIIFERFSKIDRSYTKEYNGTGLGLAICKSLVELLGGEIRVVSYVGKGSTFYFTHPLPEEANRLVVNEIINKKSEHDWSDKCILIAEDVEQNFKVLEHVIAPTKAKIIWAKDGKQAIDYIAKGNKCDCVLMDIRMPVMNGIEATREILKIADVPVIAQTVYTNGDEKELAAKAGCVGYISKPAQADEIINTIAKYILNAD